VSGICGTLLAAERAARTKQRKHHAVKGCSLALALGIRDQRLTHAALVGCGVGVGGGVGKVASGGRVGQAWDATPKSVRESQYSQACHAETISDRRTTNIRAFMPSGPSAAKYFPMRPRKRGCSDRTTIVKPDR
jgi:hypothetical protein